MATILDSYDLSGGDTLSSEVSAPNNVRVKWIVASATDSDQIVKLTFQVYDGGGNYIALKDEKLNDVIVHVKGNAESDINLLGVNSSSMKVKVETETTCDGTLTIYTYES